MKLAICNEVFQTWNDIERTVSFVKEVGYDGLEIAPFTFAPYATDIDSATRRRVRSAAARSDLEIVGIHWVLVGPEGLHLTSPDRAVRTRTAEYLVDLAHFCGDIGGSVIVFGSPKQRQVPPGVTAEQARDYAVEVFSGALPACEERGVTICMEPLTTLETNFCNTAEETVALIERIGHPRFRLLLDTKAMAQEPADRPATITRYAPWLAHYHANDTNLDGPGWGEVDFGPIVQALHDVGYGGYLSVEVFRFEPGPEAIATRSLEYLRRFVQG